VQMVAAAALDDRERVALRRGQLTSDRVEARQNRLVDSTGVTEGDRVRPYRPAGNRKVTKASLGSTWSTRSCHLRAKIIVAHVDRLAPYLGAARDEQP
jgi:hypothetical protein